MARGSRKASAPSAWSAVFYLLLAFVAPLAFLGTASAQEDVNAQNDSYGTGAYICSHPEARCHRLIVD